VTMRGAEWGFASLSVAEHQAFSVRRIRVLDSGDRRSSLLRILGLLVRPLGALPLLCCFE
jgi:hypothetical protein